MGSEPITVRTGDRMGESGNHETEEYGTTRLDQRGRLTIPKGLREDLNLGDGTVFRVVREGSAIRLMRADPDLETVTRDEPWGNEAFRDAGEATFGER